MNMLSTVVSFVAVCFALAAVWYALRVAKYVRDYNEKSVALREIAEIQAELLKQADSIAALGKTMASLRSRIGMRKLRDKNASGEPDSRTHPEEWKAWKREQLHNKRYNR